MINVTNVNLAHEKRLLSHLDRKSLPLQPGSLDRDASVCLISSSYLKEVKHQIVLLLLGHV